MPRKNKIDGPGFYITKTGKKIVFSEEWKKNISLSKMGKKRNDMRTEEARDKFRKIALEKGYGKWMIGKKASDETRKKMRESAKRGKESHWFIHGKTKELKSFYQRRRVVRKKNGGNGFSVDEWERLLEKYEKRCLCCGKYQTQKDKLQADHVIPLFLGGRDEIENIQPLCQHCNSSKGKKHIDYREFYGSK